MQFNLSVCIISSLLFFFSITGQAQNRSRYRDSLQQQLLVEKNDTTSCRICYLLSQDFFDDNSDSARYWTDRGMERAKKLKWEKGIAAMNSNYATIYNFLGDQRNGMAYLEKSIAFNIKPGNERNLASDYINMAGAWQQLGNFPKAIEYLFKALPIVDKLDNIYLKGVLLGDLADLFLGQSNLEKSNFYARQHINLGLGSKDSEILSFAYLRMGENYLKAKRIDSSVFYLEKGLSLAVEREDKKLEAQYLSNLAVANEDDHPKKMELMLQAQKIFDNSFEKYTSSIINIGNIGGTYASMALNDSLSKYSTPEKKKFLELANTYLLRAISFANETQDLENVRYFSKDLSEVQEAKGDYKNALINFKLSTHLNDSLYSQENKNAIANKEAEYLEQLMQKKNEVHKLELQRFWLIGIIALALLIIIAALLINYFRFQKIKTEHRLRQKEAEEVARELLHQNNITESELKAIRSQMNPHFIFNALNSLESYIMDNDKKSACKLVQKFAGLSRLILENSTHSLVLASKEWKALILYTDLQALRYNQHFAYKFSVGADIDLNSFYLPPMLIQPLVENAILHAVLHPDNEQPFLNVIMEKVLDQIKITVEDNGPGITNAEKVYSISPLKEKSLGIQFIEDRIKMLNQNYNKPQASFHLQNKENGKGAIAVLILPVWTGVEMKEAM